MVSPMSRETEPQCRVALITGAARRVGRAIALRLADEGFDVCFTYNHSADEARQLTAAIESKGRRAMAIQADLTAPAPAVARISDAFPKTFDRLDALINNASIYERASLADASEETMRRLWAIHAESPVLLCQRFAPMLRQNRGGVVNMLDLLAETPSPAYLIHSASKAALWNLTLGLARELAPEVRVNGIAPGVVDWPADYPEDDRRKYLQRVPLQRPGTPEDVAEAIAYLLNPQCYMTGQILRLDGGRSIT
jgi:pteridine reductase